MTAIVTLHLWVVDVTRIGNIGSVQRASMESVGHVSLSPCHASHATLKSWEEPGNETTQKCDLQPCVASQTKQN